MGITTKKETCFPSQMLGQLSQCVSAGFAVAIITILFKFFILYVPGQGKSFLDIIQWEKFYTFSSLFWSFFLFFQKREEGKLQPLKIMTNFRWVCSLKYVITWKISEVIK